MRRLLVVVIRWRESSILNAAHQREAALEASYCESLIRKEELCDTLLKEEELRRESEAAVVRDAELQALREAECRAVADQERERAEIQLSQTTQRARELELQLQQAQLELGEKELILRSSLGWDEALELNVEPIGLPALAKRVRSLPHNGVAALKAQPSKSPVRGLTGCFTDISAFAAAECNGAVEV